MKAVHRCAVGRVERDMRTVGFRLRAGMQPQGCCASRPQSRVRILDRGQLVAQARQRSLIEAHAGFQLPDSQTDMVVHDVLH